MVKERLEQSFINGFIKIICLQPIFTFASKVTNYWKNHGNVKKIDQHFEYQTRFVIKLGLTSQLLLKLHIQHGTQGG
jgi:hypothetical protein